MINKGILNSCHAQGFDENELYGAYKIFFGTMVSESRLKIINYLRSGKKNVSEIMERLNINQTRVSHDLQRLRQCGFVNVKNDGKFRYYELNEENIKPLMDIIEKHMAKYCIHILRSNKGEKDNDKKEQTN